MAQTDIGIDLGTTTIIIAQAGQGVVLKDVYKRQLVGGLGPAAYFDIVLGAVEITALGQLVEDAGVHHAGHEAVGGGRRACLLYTSRCV